MRAPEDPPEDPVKAARHLEIKQRYQRQARRHAGGTNNLRLGEVRRLFILRGIPAHQVDDEIARTLDIDNLWQWPADELGAHLQLTFSERLKLVIRTIRCIDRTPEEVSKFYADKKLVYDREKKRIVRARMPRRPKKLTPRAEAIAGMLSSRRWVKAADLIADAMAHPAFRKRGRRAKPLDREAARTAVHRALKELAKYRMIDTKKLAGQRGLTPLWVRWRV